MKPIFSMLAVVIALTSVPALAEEPPQAAAETAKPADPTQRIVCRTEDEIGSRVRKRRVCMTVAQWRELGAQSGMATERRSTQTSMGGN
jgi:hypothetical protein